MSKRMVLDTDPLTGRVRYFYELADGRFAVESRVDVEPVIEQNKTLARFTPHKHGDWHMGGIPIMVYAQLQKTWRGLGLSTEERREELKKFLNNSDHSAFRVRRGKL